MSFLYNYFRILRGPDVEACGTHHGITGWLWLGRISGDHLVQAPCRNRAGCPGLCPDCSPKLWQQEKFLRRAGFSEGRREFWEDARSDGKRCLRGFCRIKQKAGWGEETGCKWVLATKKWMDTRGEGPPQVRTIIVQTPINAVLFLPMELS